MLKALICCTLSLAYAGSSCASLTIPYDPETMSFPVSVQQAESSIRAWSSDPSLQLVLIGIGSMNLDWSWPWRYEFRSEDEAQRFDVDCDTGEVLWWGDRQLESAYNTQRALEDPGPKLSDEQLTQIARQFLSARYTGFTELGMQPVTSGWFARRLEGSVWDCGSSCSVGTNPWTGDVYLYVAHRGSSPAVSLTPVISQAVAEATALGAFCGAPQVKSVFLLTNDGLWVDRDDLDNQRLAWIVQVVVCDVEEYTLAQYQQEIQEDYGLALGRIRNVKVDAHTGEVFCIEGGGSIGSGSTTGRHGSLSLTYVSRPLLHRTVPYRKVALSIGGKSVQTNLPPVVVRGLAYVPLRTVAAAMRLRPIWNKGRITLNGERRFEITPPSRSARIERRSTRLRAAPFILFQRSYICVDDIEPLFGIEATWDARAGVVNLVTQRSAATSTPKRQPHD